MMTLAGVTRLYSACDSWLAAYDHDAYIARGDPAEMWMDGSQDETVRDAALELLDLDEPQ